MRIFPAMLTVLVLGPLLACRAPAQLQVQANNTLACAADNAGLKLPDGFCATIFAEGVPRARHMTVAGNGDVFVITNRGGGGNQAAGAPPAPAPGIYRLRDADRDGKAELVERVADGIGTGVLIANNALYAENGGAVILRRPFRPGTTDFTDVVDTIVMNLPPGGGHFQRNFVIRGNDLFVNVGSATNSCTTGQGNNTGPDPCTELETRAGIWRFSAIQKNQSFSATQRYATGFRNAVALTMNPSDNQVYAAQHGRDNLGPIMGLDSEYNAENPGEEFHRIVEGDYGWPYCYYSHFEKKKVLAPEYGGDGKQVGRCADKVQPIYVFPGHWAPNAVLFYTGTQFPAQYRDGVFIAFHGSWNRAPLPQAGFNVSFLPLRNGAAAGAHEVFADGFNERRTRDAPATARSYRPSGLAQMPDGSMLVSDDARGTIFRIAYRGR